MNIVFYYYVYLSYKSLNNNKMKKLITTALIAFAITSYSQQRDYDYAYIAGGFDLANSVGISKVPGNGPELNYQLKIGAISKKFEVGLQYESYNAIDFKQYGVYVNYIFPIAGDFDLSFGIETGSIIRTGNSNFLFYGGNSEVRYHISEKIALGLQGNLRNRTDLTYLYDKHSAQFKGSVMFNVYYRLN